MRWLKSHYHAFPLYTRPVDHSHLYVVNYTAAFNVALCQEKRGRQHDFADEKNKKNNCPILLTRNTESHMAKTAAL